MKQSTSEKQDLSRGLKNRHVQLLAIGGAIGTGLFLGSGRSIHLAGPSILFSYIITGIICFFIMRALGELLLTNLNYHSFVDFVYDYLGSGAAFITGWTYWFCWVSVAMADVTAAGLYIQYWFPSIPQWVPSLIVLVVLLIMNLTAVKLFGEMEFWFALIKVVAILALIIIGTFMIIKGFSTDTGVSSFSNLWSHGGWFPNGISGFILSFQMVVFAFAGIELVGLTAGETENPESVIPKAINNIPIRIIIFYIGALAVIMSIYPWNSINPDKSPFVQVFAAVGIAAAASIVNFVVLTSAASACNSGIFSTSRMIFSLAKENNAPESMKKLTNNKVPANATVFSAAVILISIILNYVMPEGVFVLITSISTFCFIFIWAIIIICHLKYRKANPELAAKSKFKMPLYPIINYVILTFFAFVIIVLAFNEETRIALFVTPVWFIVLGIIYKVVKSK
ncbi:D-serine/D-alanine/glycine transporter [Clostridium saccharoperbutylacetonicum]|uniref:D-serine/D-alanine/glycine:proton symporter, AAT family n=1 Tax=Clostridium saccharoperbutylacetonicum N1-4(HMT) TaxID=931276 RepID=M1ME27_9CLOT|nr:amino acid permease [Clostridium saccharoperbutylacetonicum]AGF56169.1 D-serine/D-alanine/glycine:proton symporter, AAT family [Clostridium saccharoperbutylacetonicum N1-4(HMT)]NRT63090.1 D-serine/D-alanine/glycine transporter [Clostridium saccharoperbutylacetonicum]NSB26447.1 D-serine/D-alanine/glycine transporter [Clostridium saccharoperbutylacetonicum]NSB45800.1 D-serine/D-alanine/glycine transporter [Clostridium saccharoperbutylacetonicum]